MSRALKAKTASELAVLFDDLPEPRPPSASDSTAYQAPPWQQGAQPSFEIPPWQRTPAASPGIPHRVHPVVPGRSNGDKVLAAVATGSWLAVILFCFATSWKLLVADVHPDLHLHDRRQYAATAGPQRMTDSQPVRWGIVGPGRIAAR